MSKMESSEKQFYPNYESTTWTRSCEEEVTVPIEGQVTGAVPSWLRGGLLRNGPGSVRVGGMEFEHLFDCTALLHRFAILDGSVTYQCRFLRSNTFKKNRAADRIVVTEFGTRAVPDPCRTIYDRFASFFNIDDMLTDNALVSIYPFGDEVYALSETPIMHRIDPVTLDTLERKNFLNSSIAIVCHTAHPHITPSGDVYNVGISILKGRPQHIVVKFPHVEKGDKFKKAHIVGSMAPRWPVHPAYMHTFGVTDNYFVIVEQPLSISLLKCVGNHWSKEPVISSLQWNSEHETHVVLISRQTGKEVKRFRTETLFYVHMINSFERDGMLVVDLCAYKDASVLNGMYVSALANMQGNADFAEWFRSRPKRLEVDLDAPDLTRIEPRLLAGISCEMPRINYSLHNGKPYRYFYAMGTDMDDQKPGGLTKVDTNTGEVKSWHEVDCYASEPVFVPAPDAEEEDDGVVLSILLWGSRSHAVTLLVLDARSMHELARAEFVTPSPAPKCLHGWFLPERA